MRCTLIVVTTLAFALLGCGGDGGGGSGGAGGANSTGGTFSDSVDCGSNPGPGDTCTTNGKCASNPACFCLSGSISCAAGGGGGR